MLSVHGQPDVIWVTPCERSSVSFHRQLDVLFNNISVLPPKLVLNYITIILWEESTGKRSLSLKKGQLCGKRINITMSSWCILTVKDHVNIIELSASNDTINRTQLRAGNMPPWSVIWQTWVFVASSHCRKCCNWYYHRNNTNISHFPGNLRLLFLKQASK